MDSVTRFVSVGFCHQTASPGPIRDTVLWDDLNFFLILVEIFVKKNVKLSSVSYTAELRPGGIGISYTAECILGSVGTGILHWGVDFIYLREYSTKFETVIGNL